MQTTIDFLDLLRKQQGLTSDYQLAKYLGIRNNRISNYRRGQTYFDEDACILFAHNLNLPPAYVMACIAAERTHSEQAKTVWRNVAESLYGIAASLIVAAVLFAPSAPAEAVQLFVSSEPCTVYYVKWVKNIFQIYFLAPLFKLFQATRPDCIGNPATRFAPFYPV